MIRHLLLAAALALAALVNLVPARAGDYADGYTEDGYTYASADGYWYLAGAPYTRAKVVTPGYTYYAGGCAYTAPSTYNWKYTAATAYKPTLPAYTDAGWRSKLLDIAKQRDVFEGKLRAAGVEHQQYLEGLAALGLNGNFRISGYGLPVNYSSFGYNSAYLGSYGSPVSGSVTLGSYGASGSTLYGYSVGSLKDIYGDASPAVLYQQASRLVQNAQQLAGQGNSDFAALIAQDGTNRSRVAEILAKGQAASAALAAAQAAPTSAFQTKTFTFGPSAGAVTGAVSGAIPGAPVGPTAADTASLSAAWQQSAARCVACHGATGGKGGFSVANFPSLAMNDRLKIVQDRLTTVDAARLMPRGADGGPGQRFSDDEVLLWLIVPSAGAMPAAKP